MSDIDVIRELSAREKDLRTAVLTLRRAAEQVIGTWEEGDLADAVRELAQAVEYASDVLDPTLRGKL